MDICKANGNTQKNAKVGISDIALLGQTLNIDSRSSACWIPLCRSRRPCMRQDIIGNSANPSKTRSIAVSATKTTNTMKAALGMIAIRIFRIDETKS